jgi:cell division septation protein DedD
MPDLNLQDEEGSLENLESPGEGEAQAPAEEEEEKGKGKGAMILVAVLAILIVGAGGVYLLNRFGIIKIFGKKAAPEVVQLEPSAAGTSGVGAADTSAAKMIETPPLEGTKRGAATSAGKPSSAAASMREMPTSAAAPKLGEMKGEFTIQVSAWRDQSVATEMVKRLADAGYPAFVEERAYKDGSWYTVRVGRYPSRKGAQDAAQSFAEEIKSNYWIDRVRGK